MSYTEISEYRRRYDKLKQEQLRLQRRRASLMRIEDNEDLRRLRATDIPHGTAVEKCFYALRHCMDENLKDHPHVHHVLGDIVDQLEESVLEQLVMVFRNSVWNKKDEDMSPHGKHAEAFLFNDAQNIERLAEEFGMATHKEEKVPTPPPQPIVPPKVQYLSSAVHAFLEAIRIRVHADHVLLMMNLVKEKEHASEHNLLLASNGAIMSHNFLNTSSNTATGGNINNISMNNTNNTNNNNANVDVSLRLVAMSPVVEHDPTEVPHSRGIAGVVYTSGVSVNVTKDSAPDLLHNDSIIRKVTKVPPTAVLAMPVPSQATGKYLGVLQFIRTNGNVSSAPDPFAQNDEIVVMRFCDVFSHFLHFHGTDSIRSGILPCAYQHPSETIGVPPRVPATRVYSDLVLAPHLMQIPDIAHVASYIPSAPVRHLVYRGGVAVEAHRLAISRKIRTSDIVENTTFITVTEHITNLENMWKELFEENARMHSSCREWQMHMAQVMSEMASLKGLVREARGCATLESMKRTLQLATEMNSNQHKHEKGKSSFFMPGVRTYTSDLSADIKNDLISGDGKENDLLGVLPPAMRKPSDSERFVKSPGEDGHILTPSPSKRRKSVAIHHHITTPSSSSLKKPPFKTIEEIMKTLPKTARMSSSASRNNSHGERPQTTGASTIVHQRNFPSMRFPHPPPLPPKDL